MISDVTLFLWMLVSGMLFLGSAGMSFVKLVEWDDVVHKRLWQIFLGLGLLVGLSCFSVTFLAMNDTPTTVIKRQSIDLSTAVVRIHDAAYRVTDDTLAKHVRELDDEGWTIYPMDQRVVRLDVKGKGDVTKAYVETRATNGLIKWYDKTLVVEKGQ